jgi:hypothetical protein
VPEGFLTGLRYNNLAEILKHRLDCHQIALIVIDDEHARAFRFLLLEEFGRFSNGGADWY